MSDADTSFQQARTELFRLFPVAAVAYSTDGREVSWAGPVDIGLEVGGLAIAAHPDGDAVVLQIRDVRLVEREAAELSVNIVDPAIARFAGAALVKPVIRAAAGSAVVLGRLDNGVFVAAADTAVGAFGERPVRPVTVDELSTVTAGLDQSAKTIRIGSHRQSGAVPARLRAKGFGRHTFMCGQSGSGKTYTTGVLFERLLADTGLPLIVIDPNSDHIHLGALADPDDTSPEGARYRELAGSVRVAGARGTGADLILCADFSDFDADVQALLLQLHPISDMDQYTALRRLTQTLSAPYSIGDLASAAVAAGPDTAPLAARIANLGLDTWGIWRRDGEASMLSTHPEGLPRCLVLDVGSLSRPDERAAASLVLLRNRWARRRERTPMLIAVDEAHNVFPASTSNPLLQETAELGALIAGEGRKFGLHLFIATQRPSKVHPNVVSQCDNLILMRMNGAADVQDLTELFSHVPEPLLRQSLSFGLGQALFAGPIAPVPLIAQVGSRLTREGGGDVPTTWA